jgi:hypothetical protein
MSDVAERCAEILPATTVIGAAASGAPVKARQSPPDGAKRLEGREPAATIRGRRRTVTRGSAARSARRAGARERRDASQQHDE